MKLIAIETSTENCSVGLLHQNQISHRSQVAPQKHAELLLGYLDELLSEQQLNKAELNGIVFGQGPGAFTGVRIAMSVVQGLALAWDVPVMAVSTMHNMAYQLWQQNPEQDQRILVANDARMGEVYWAEFAVEKGQLKRLSPDQLSQPSELTTTSYDVCAGSAFQKMVTVEPGVLKQANLLPDATALLQMAQRDFASQAQNIIDIKPSYIREKVVFN